MQYFFIIYFNMVLHGSMERIAYIILFILCLLHVLNENDHELWSDSDDEDDVYAIEGSETPPDMQETSATDNYSKYFNKVAANIFSFA